MASEPDESGWSAEGLARLWADYASCLAELNDGTAERFCTEVLGPFESDNPIRAVTAWATDWSDPPEPTRTLSTPELSNLSRRLGELVDKLDAPVKVFRWFSREPHPLATAETKALLAEVHRAFDLLSRPQSQNAAAYRESLAGIVRSANAMLESAPATWAAALYASRLSKVLLELPTEAEPFLPLVPQMTSLKPNRDDPASLAISLLEALAASCSGPLGKLPPERAAWRDRVLGCIRGWAAGRELEVLPTAWSFRSPPSAEELGRAGATLAAVYRAEEPLGTIVRIKSFGVHHRETVLRPAVVSVSAGAAPTGLVELEELSTGASAELLDRLREWRTASLERRLESAAVEVFVLYWNRFRNPWLAEHPEVAAHFGERLSIFLMENFGLVLLYPSLFQDLPAGWVQPAEGTRMTTGRVREVLQPGLADRDGELRVPARVSVE